LAQVTSLQELVELCTWAQEQGFLGKEAAGSRSLHILAGGSNLVVADEGVQGLVLKMAWREVRVEKSPHQVLLIAAAGTPLQEVVDLAVAEGWAGLECLAGIPGSVGATPVQNVGAYGQEVGQSLAWVEAFHCLSRRLRRFSPGQCRLAYRHSIFRRPQNPWVITRVAFRLRPGGPPTLVYPELVRLLALGQNLPSLQEVRQAVLHLRREKGMLLQPGEESSQTVGSFFTNPILSLPAWKRLKARLWAMGILPAPEEPPHFPQQGKIKVPAAWLVEKAGFSKGFRQGAFGLSPRHALALVHWGGGTSRDLVALAARIQQKVEEAFALVLEPEPVFWGFGSALPLRHALRR
jgi:UDP-N-acetylmuramate dehydrogenase